MEKFSSVKEFYEVGKPELEQRTKERLDQIQELGLTEVGYGQFGIKDVISGLYIEKVWSYSEEEWNEYIEFIKKTAYIPNIIALGFIPIPITEIQYFERMKELAVLNESDWDNLAGYEFLRKYLSKWLEKYQK